MGIWKLNISLGKIVALVMLVDNIYSPISEFNIMYVKYNLDKVAVGTLEDLAGLVGVSTTTVIRFARMILIYLTV